MKTLLRTLALFLFITVLTGVAYPLLVTGIARVFFPYRAGGSIVVMNGRAVGSELIGQASDSTAGLFESRPSATGYSAMPSGGSNLGPCSDRLFRLAEQRKLLFGRQNGLASGVSIPSEMVSASASGVDPHISPEAALLQVPRVCRERGFDSRQEADLRKLIGELTEAPQAGFLGPHRINVFILNLRTEQIR